MILLAGTPDTEQLLLGTSPFFRAEAADAALRAGDFDLLARAAVCEKWDARRLAAERLGGKTPAALLKDPIAVVREAALRALGDRAPLQARMKLLGDADDAVRTAAAWSLMGERKAAKRLRVLRKDKAVMVRMAAFAALSDWAELRKLAERRDPSDAVPALIALGRAGRSAEASFLVSRLSRAVQDRRREKHLLFYDEQPHAHFALARAVADLARRKVTAGGKDIGTLLEKIAGRADLSGSGGVLLAEAAAGARDVELAAAVLEALVKKRDASKRIDAVFAPALSSVLHTFARESWPELSPALMPFLEDRDASIRVAVTHALSPKAAAKALGNSNPLVRAAACHRVDGLNVLKGAAGDSDVRVVVAAARALGRLRTAAARQTLRDLRMHPSADVRRAVVGAILRLPVKDRWLDLYDMAVDDPDPSVRATTGAALALLENPAALRRALDALVGKSRVKRQAAIELAHRLTAARNGYDAAAPADGAARWNDWWKRKGGRLREPDAFRYHVEDLRKRGLDLVLVLDATGSMTPVLEATKRRIESVVSSLRVLVPDLRMRLVAYRDHREAFLTLASPLTADPRLLEDFLAGVPAYGGGDAPESVLSGLQRAMERTRWRKGARRIVLLFGDAPPHQRPMPLLETIVREFKGTAHAVDVSGYPFDRGGPVRIAAFRKIAKWGGGKAVRLTREDELLKLLLVLALGPEHRASIEALFGV